jgi:hypothetical protein
MGSHLHEFIWWLEKQYRKSVKIIIRDDGKEYLPIEVIQLPKKKKLLYGSQCLKFSNKRIKLKYLVVILSKWQELPE